MSLNLTRRVLELVGVVGDVDFLLADELPVVAVEGAVVHVELVRGAHRVGGGAGVVVGDVGRAANPTLARVVEPGVAVLLDLVHGLRDQQDAAREPRRRHDLLFEEEDPVVELLFAHVLHAVLHVELVVELDQGVAAAAGRRRLADVAGGAVGAIAAAGGSRSPRDRSSESGTGCR